MFTYLLDGYDYGSVPIDVYIYICMISKLSIAINWGGKRHDITLKNL